MRTLAIVGRAEAYQGRVAIEASEGAFTYDDLLAASAHAAAQLLGRGGHDDLGGARVAFMTPNGFRHVALQWGIWRAGGVAVPLCLTHPAVELEYAITDAGADLVVAAPAFEQTLAPVCGATGVPFLDIEALVPRPVTPADTSLPDIRPDRPAMILYTSGSTGRPKGVVWSHDAVGTQAEVLCEAWGWGPSDHALHALPLHHVHGVVNVLTCSLWAGAVCEMLEQFDAAAVWERFAAGDVTVFMAVPTIYYRLIAHWEEALPRAREAMSAAARRLRLMVSGSAALPVRTLERWRQITGHTLLERFGTTETGMALSNPLDGRRVAGAVGTPLPTVDVRLVDEGGAAVAPGTPGELEVRGPSVFKAYWNKPDATAAAFRDGWYRTGDVAVCEAGVYRILGRASVDIIKTGGEKVSALEVEEVLRDHPAVRDCAVVGTPDPEWGERVCAAVVTVPGSDLELEDLRAWARTRLAPYKLPRSVAVLDDLPRNAMGKVVKPALKEHFAPQ